MSCAAAVAVASSAAITAGTVTAVTSAVTSSLSDITMWKPHLCVRAARSEGGGRERLRIGYMSSDFVNHPTADLIIRALLLHNSEQFETFCYSLAKDDNSTYRRVLEREIPNFRLLPKGAQCADVC